MVKRDWRRKDDLLVLYIFMWFGRRNPTDRCPRSVCAVAGAVMGRSAESVALRYRNLLYLHTDGRSGAPKYAAKARNAWEQYRGTSLRDMEKLMARQFSKDRLYAVKSSMLATLR